VNQWLTDRANALGVEGLTPDEVSTLLDLAGHAAHESGARTNAPLLCYLLGRAQGQRSLTELAEIVTSTS
jgi:uncharacterized protein DUF6457